MSVTASCCAKKTPWGTLSSENADGPITSFVEIMSEELALSLQKGDEANHQNNKDSVENHLQFSNQSFRTKIKTDFDEFDDNFDADCTDDLIMARMLQHEFDREHDKMVLRQQGQLNGNGKIKVLFDKYLYTHPLDETESSCDDDEEFREFSINKAYDQRNPNFGVSGFIRNGDGTIITKHDKEVTARKNTVKFPPDFPTGDAIDVKLNNKVYNVLKKHSVNEQKRRQRFKDKNEIATTMKSMDTRTRLILFKLVDTGILRSINGVVATGKESVVLSAIGNPGRMKESLAKPVIPSECAVKIYKTVLNEFRNRADYVKDDFRYKNCRKILTVCAEKELHNMNRMNRAGLRCPRVVHLVKHVLVLSLIGEDGNPAPTLNRITFEDSLSAATAFDECRQFATRLYRECHLVHADLSEFNVLYWKGHCWFIDMAQAVDTSHPEALSFLARDCHNILEYFAKTEIADLPSPRTLFNEITQLNIESNERFFTQVQEFSDVNRSMQFRKDKANPADCMLRKYQEERMNNCRDESPTRDYK